PKGEVTARARSGAKGYPGMTRRLMTLLSVTQRVPAGNEGGHPAPRKPRYRLLRFAVRAAKIRAQCFGKAFTLEDNSDEPFFSGARFVVFSLVPEDGCPRRKFTTGS